MCNYDMLMSLDFSVRDIESRLKVVNDILYNDGVLNDSLIYSLDNINVHLTQNDALNTYNKTVKMLEKMADYLLYAYKKKDDDVVYKIYSYTDLVKKAMKEKRSVGMIIKGLYFNYAANTNKNELVYIRYGSNSLKLKKQKITKKDLTTIPGLSIYEKAKELIKKELCELDNLDIKNKKRKATLRALYGEIVSDQLLMKDSFLGTIYFKNVQNMNVHDSDYVQINYSDKNNILELLKCDADIMSSIGCVVHDLNEIIYKIKWSTLEQKIIELYRQDKKIIEISYELGIEYHTARYNLKVICDRIMKNYDDSYKYWINKNKSV